MSTPRDSLSLRRSTLWLVLAVAGAVTALISARPWWSSSAPAPAVSVASVTPAPAEVRQRAWQTIQPRLDASDRSAQTQIDRSLAIVNEFFAERSQNSRAFGEEVLALRGKWQFIHSRLPYADKDAHYKFLAQRFEKTIFSPEELRAVIEEAVTAHLAGVEGIENRLLVDIRADLADDASIQALPTIRSDASLQEDFRQLATQVARQVSNDLGVDVLRETGALVTFTVAEVIARRVAVAVAARLGMSAGILSAGAGSSVATLGMGLVACIAVDLGVDWFMRLAGYDPPGQVAQKVQATLEHVRELVVEGDREAVDAYAALRESARQDTDPAVRLAAERAVRNIDRKGLVRGLRAELQGLDQARAEIRRETLRLLILEGCTK